MSRIELFVSTPHPLEVICTAAKRCYSNEEEITLPDDKGRYIDKILDSGHTSVLEHVSFTFHIRGISRVCSHQLVRHRLANFSQMSQRYSCPIEDSESKKFSVVIPDGIAINPKALEIYNKAIAAIEEAYKDLVNMGIHKENARYLLPGATKTSLFVTMNARELYEVFFPLRCCLRAQQEIRLLAKAMLKKCKGILPEVFNRCGPSCITFGKCPEGEKGCKMNSV